jgi:metallo-beta-lactamase class B
LTIVSSPAPATRALVALAALAGLAIPPSVVAAQADWTAPLEPFRIADELYYVGTAGLAAYLFASEEGHVLIDVPLDENVERVLANVRALGFDPADIRVQLASHAHFDHVGGIARMLERTGAELVLSEADASFVESGRDFGLAGLAGYPPARPARTIRDHDTVSVGGVTLTAHVTPGHTPGCTSWGGTVHIEGRPYTFLSVCSLSVLGSYRLVGDDATYPGQGRDYCASVAHLRTLEPDIFLAPHGSFFGLSEKLAGLRRGDRLAFVERERYRRYLDAALADIEERLRVQGHEGGCAALLR